MKGPHSPNNGGALRDEAWGLLRSLAARTNPTREGRCLEFEVGGTALRVEASTGELLTRPALPEDVLQMLELCLPLCLAGSAGQPFVYAHLGQSLDGQIATASGASRYVTSAANLLHMHRLRALADAVIVGAGTVERDDPQLTTRLVPGSNPVRVVIDPGLRLPPDRHVFSDRQARTIVVCRATAGHAASFGNAELLELPSLTADLPPEEIVHALADLGLRRLFVEGGGVTVSRFLSMRALDRLHVAVCPVFIGRGRPGVVLPGVDSMEQTLRPSARRFLLGDDVLFDCSFSRPSAGSGAVTP